jgi:hypothetical protein
MIIIFCLTPIRTWLFAEETSLRVLHHGDKVRVDECAWIVGMAVTMLASSSPTCSLLPSFPDSLFP